MILVSFSVKPSLFTVLLWPLSCKERWLISLRFLLRNKTSSFSTQATLFSGLVCPLVSPISFAGNTFLSYSKILTNTDSQANFKAYQEHKKGIFSLYLWNLPKLEDLEIDLISYVEHIKKQIVSVSELLEVDVRFLMLSSRKHSWRYWLLKFSEVPLVCSELSWVLFNAVMSPSQQASDARTRVQESNSKIRSHWHATTVEMRVKKYLCCLNSILQSISNETFTHPTQTLYLVLLKITTLQLASDINKFNSKMEGNSNIISILFIHFQQKIKLEIEVML